MEMIDILAQQKHSERYTTKYTVHSMSHGLLKQDGTVEARNHPPVNTAELWIESKTSSRISKYCAVKDL